MRQTLSNNLLKVTVDSHGAEIVGITGLRTGHEYLWNGDKRFWGRHSPVLFPIVGSVWEGRYRMDGREYRIGQHGFARDREFEPVVTDRDDELWYALESDESTLALYPRRFRLEIGYRLTGERVVVMWRVTNNDDRTMHFQIGAHPAFMYPAFDPGDPVHGYLLFDGRGLTSELIGEKGCVGASTVGIERDSEGMVPVTARTFDINTIILAGRQVRRVSLLTKERSPYLSVLFDAPLVGVWSPSADCPFVCIEPWWGRCDRVGFEGEFAEREHVTALDPSETFEAAYTMIFENV